MRLNFFKKSRFCDAITSDRKIDTSSISCPGEAGAAEAAAAAGAAGGPGAGAARRRPRPRRLAAA